MQTYEDYIGLKGLWGVEWHNTGCVNSAYKDTFQPIEDLLRKGENVFPLATDDAHHIRDCFGGWVMVKANNLEYETIYNALEHGDFYSSTGPVINELYIENGIVHISTSKVKSIQINTERREGNDQGKNYCIWCYERRSRQDRLHLQSGIFIGQGGENSFGS